MAVVVDRPPKDRATGRPLAAARPSDVRSWTAKLKAGGLADSYVCGLHNRLSQLTSDAVHDGVLARSPCSRRTTPGAGKPRPYVATTEQVWALHDAVAEHLRPTIPPGAFGGLRTAEAVGLRVIDDVDVMRGIVRQHRAGRGGGPDDGDLTYPVAGCRRMRARVLVLGGPVGE
ncbi:MAG: Phage integrase family protein [Blastococcus sp.]|jgi:integrase|nr:Phage integrase family protein [Blastococcus sp.]